VRRPAVKLRSLCYRLRRLFRRCQRCRRLGAETYRQRTHYVDDSQNIVTLCPDCRRENDEHWDVMWYVK
jgi:hypothetical protein